MAALVEVARTGDRLRDFSPYVPAVTPRGDVLFQAEHDRGGSGVYRAGDVAIEPVIEREGLRVVSHPCGDAEGAVAFFAETGRKTGAFLLRGGELLTMLDRGAGPLGPTIHEGAVAFRASIAPGVAAVLRGDGRRVQAIASAGPDLAGFEGLPLITPAGVTARVQLRSGAPAILRYPGGVSLVEGFTDLSRFPSALGASVAFAGVRADGAPGAFVLREGRLERIAGTADGFESFRGVLLGGGEPVLIATRGGRLGVFRGLSPVIAVGDAWDGAIVSALALNPVSVNERGVIAIRVALADGSQRILRSDP